MYKLKPLSSRELNLKEFPYQIASEDNLITGSLTPYFILKKLTRVAQTINERTTVPFTFWGSMALYAYLFNVGLADSNLVYHRVNGGKNDFDVGVSLIHVDRIMNDFNWGKKERETQTGPVGQGKEVIDIMIRENLPSFQSQKIMVWKTLILFASPEEMMFEKYQSLAFNKERWPEKIGETKWGLDIQILKTYLLKELDLNRVELEDYLSRRWQIYIKEKSRISQTKNFEVIEDIASKIDQGMGAQKGLREYFKIRFGISDKPIKEELTKIFGEPESATIEKLTKVQKATDFERLLKGMIKRSYKKTEYTEIQKKAELTYKEILPQRFIGDSPAYIKKMKLQLNQT